jgi:osmotically-inducible protein OsmY
VAINVETLKGTVQLSGFATSLDEDGGERLARSVSGVITVRTTSWCAPDAAR